MIFAQKINKIPEFYTIVVRKMPKFYMPKKYFSRFFFGGGEVGMCSPCPPSPMPMVVVVSVCGVGFNVTDRLAVSACHAVHVDDDV